MGAVEGDPIAFAGSNQRLASSDDFRFVRAQMSGRLLEHDLSDVGCVHRRPANPLEPDIGPAMLGLGDVGRSDAEALVAEARRGDAKAIEVAGRKTRRANKTDKQAV